MSYYEKDSKTPTPGKRTAEAIRLRLPHTSRIIKRLSIRCSRWRGRLLRLPEEHFSRLVPDQAPFTSRDLGVIWETKTVAYAGDVYWPEVIHEMGHVFVDLAPPHAAEEYSWLGWEIALARRVGTLGPWIKNNADYLVSKPPPHEDDDDPYVIMGSLNKGELARLIQDRLSYAASTGLLSRWGTPLQIR